MASIKERKNKNGDITSYQITVSLGRNPDGRKLLKTTTYKPKATTPGKARKEVEQFAVIYEKQIKDGTIYTDGEKVNFAEFVNFWNEQYLYIRVTSGDMTQKCREDYNSILKRYALPELANKKLSDIKSVHIDKIVNDMIDIGRSPKTIRATFNVIKAVFDYAYRKQIINENPCYRCNPLPQIKTKNEIHYFTTEQVNRFLNEALTMEYPRNVEAYTRIQDGKNGFKQIVPVKAYTDTYRIPFQFRVFFTLAIYSGCRRSELLALTWNKINFEDHTITIDKGITYSVTNGEQIKDPKTASGKRIITLPAVCFDLLSQWKNEQKIVSLKMGTAWNGEHGKNFDNNFVFIQVDGKRMNIQTPSIKFKKIIRAYNAIVPPEKQLPEIRLHDLRHTNATHLVSQGVDFETIAKRLGHSKPSFTLDIYGHALPENDKKAAEKLDSIFSVKR